MCRAHRPSGDGHLVLSTAPELALERVPALADPHRRVSRLPGGLTNRNYRISTSDGCFVARLSSTHSDLLAIDRDAEHHNSRAAAATGIAPRVVDYRPAPAGSAEPDVLVIDWVPGRTWSAADVRDERNLPRLAAACRTLHRADRFTLDFDMFAIQRRYLQLVTDRGFRLPARYLDFGDTIADIQRALAAVPEPTVPCHNDLLAENIIDDGQRLWLIDYEYSGNNDPYFELGNIASESDLSVEQVAELVRCYAGGVSKRLIARARLWGLMSHYGWTLWASIQDAVSELDFDFWQWGMEKYDRAVAMLDGHELQRLIADVREPKHRETALTTPLSEGNWRA